MTTPSFKRLLLESGGFDDGLSRLRRVGDWTSQPWIDLDRGPELCTATVSHPPINLLTREVFCELRQIRLYGEREISAREPKIFRQRLSQLRDIRESLNNNSGAGGNFQVLALE